MGNQYAKNIQSHDSYYCSPNDLVDFISSQKKKYCLFLDIDGTLADFQLDPEDTFIPQNTLEVIQRILQHKVPVIAVTGRSVQVAQQLFSPMLVPIAGTHGLEIQMDQTTTLQTNVQADDFVQIQQELKVLCQSYPELLIENKKYAVALHYRQYPEFAEIAQQIMQTLLQRYPALKLNQGKYVFELLPKQADKGEAIQTILNYLNIPKVLPIFIGDDRTDETGFIKINRLDGISIKVGQGETQAKFRLENIEKVADFLASFSEVLATRSITKSQLVNGESTCLN
ncbi:trehalose-phosphatase [Acinetobacter puyangensis]|uniref:trehalose-phosphatase n=1 Tax=Acinetobacter puyangensis TaxID=1096779 RepID=UPI003A4D5277